MAREIEVALTLHELIHKSTTALHQQISADVGFDTTKGVAWRMDRVEEGALVLAVEIPNDPDRLRTREEWADD